MYVVSEEDAAMIRAAVERGGELAGAVEVRRLYPGIPDMEMAREHARIIAGWVRLPRSVPTVTRLRPKAGM
jgi:hypothetical protein